MRIKNSATKKCVKKTAQKNPQIALHKRKIIPPATFKSQ